MNSQIVLEEESAKRTDITSTLHKVTQRCHKLREAALPILLELLARTCPGGRDSKGAAKMAGYYYLPDDVTAYTILDAQWKYKVSLETGFLWYSKNGRDFSPLRTETGAYFDIINLWQSFNGVETVTRACDELDDDIRYILHESPEARQKRKEKQERLGKRMRKKQEDEIRYNLGQELIDGGSVQESGRNIWKAYGELYGYSLSAYQFLDTLRRWVEDATNDLWVKVEQVKDKKEGNRQFRITGTAVTDETILARQRAELERQAAEKDQRDAAEKESLEIAYQEFLKKVAVEIAQLEEEKAGLMQTWYAVHERDDFFEVLMLEKRVNEINARLKKLEGHGFFSVKPVSVKP